MEHLGTNLEFSPLLLNFVHQGVANLTIIDDARGGHANRSHAGDVGFDFFDFFRTEPGRRHAVLRGSIEDFIELRNLLRRSGHDQFAANIERHAVFVAKGTHGLIAGLRQLGLEAAGFVVNTGMDHAAVAARLVLSETDFFFNQQYACKRIATAKGSARGETDDSSTNYCEIIHRLPLEAFAYWQGWICTQTETTSVDRPIF